MRKFLSLLLLLSPTLLFAQKDSVSSDGYFSFRYENDFFNATDQYYTQGIHIELAAPFVSHSPLSRTLLKAGPGAVNMYGILVAQDCYTPSSIRRDTVIKNDRPFAAAMYAGQFLISTDNAKKRRLRTELIAGAIGPCASCEEEQKSIHRWLNNIQPLGWQFQIKNDVLLNYNVHYEQFVYGNHFMELMANGSLSVGTYKDNAGLGAWFRTGYFDPTFKADVKDQRRYIRKSQVYFFIWGSANAIGYDASMQGGLFNRSSIYTVNSAAIERGLLAGGGGIVLTLKSFSLQYSKTWITREFATGLSHGWGTISITSRF